MGVPRSLAFSFLIAFALVLPTASAATTSARGDGVWIKVLGNCLTDNCAGRDSGGGGALGDLDEILTVGASALGGLVCYEIDDKNGLEDCAVIME